MERMKLIIKRVLSLVRYMNEVLSWSERIDVYVIPLLISFLTYIIIPKFSFFSPDICENFSEKFIGGLATISGGLTAFSLTVTTILTTNSSEKIQTARKDYTNGRKRNGIRINFYELLLILNFYFVITQVFVLIFSIISLFLLEIFSTNYILIKVIVSLGSGLFLHSLIVLLYAIFSIYSLMWRED